MFVPKIDRLIGIEVYATHSLGIGGVIRQSAEDFVVREILVDGSKAEITESIKSQVLGSSDVKNRYLLCVMVKQDWDTFRVLKIIAQQLGISMRQIHIAGIKDAKAVTAQYITVENISAEDVKRVNIKDVEIRPVGYLRSKLSPYYILGNNFNITIKTIKHAKNTIKKRITQTIEELTAMGGIPNFFGHQRFGTSRPITHLVGKAIVKGNVKKAAMIFLAKPSPYEHPESRQARKQLQMTQNFRKALKEFPKQLHYERLMLKHLTEKPNDFIGAFKRLPIKLRELFPQAYQSYLFNKFLSKRIASGLSLNRAEVGDYVVNVDRSGLPMPMTRKIVTAETLGEINKAIITGKMRLAFPLVGFKLAHSLGVQGETMKQILDEEKVKLENFKINAMPEIASRGELRTALAPFSGFLLNNVSRDSLNRSWYKVNVSFTLHRGSYATIALREIMKPRNPFKTGF